LEEVVDAPTPGGRVASISAALLVATAAWRGGN